MNRDLVNNIIPVSSAGSFDSVGRKGCDRLPICDMFDVQQEIRTNTIDRTSWRERVGDRVILEYYSSDMNRGSVELGAGRDRVVARLQTGNGGNDDVKRNRPCCGVVRGGGDRNVISGSKLKHLSELEASIRDNCGVFFLVTAQLFEESLSLGRWRKFREDSEHLTTCNRTYIDVVSKHRAVSGRNREWDFGQSWIEGIYINHGIFLVSEPEHTNQAVYLDVRIGWPDADMITMLVSYSRAFYVEFHVHAVATRTNIEKLARYRNGGCVRVLGIMNALGLGQSANRKFT